VYILLGLAKKPAAGEIVKEPTAEGFFGKVANGLAKELINKLAT
jgi:ribosomal protein L29